MAVYSDNQTKGRGSKGRKWQEQKGKGIAFSLYYKIPVERLDGISLVCGIAVSDAIRDTLGIETKLKWSNDIIADNKKLGGILCESRIRGRTASVVIGIGINTNKTKDDFANENLRYATSLSVLGVENSDPMPLLESISQKLDSLLKVLADEGFAENLCDKYKQRCVTIGKDVKVTVDGNDIVAKAVDIAPNGALICKAEDKYISLHSGDVSVRGLYGYI